MGAEVAGGDGKDSSGQTAKQAAIDHNAGKMDGQSYGQEPGNDNSSRSSYEQYGFKDYASARINDAMNAVKDSLANRDAVKTIDNKKNTDGTKTSTSSSSGKGSQSSANLKTPEEEQDDSDLAAVKQIGSNLKEAANKSTVQMGAARESTEASTTEYTDKMKKLTGDDSDLAKITSKAGKDVQKTSPMEIAKEYYKNMDTILEEKTRLAKQQVDQASQMSKWYAGLNQSYEDIAGRYNKAIVGLGDAERTQMQGQNQQDYAAMSALGAQNTLPGQGRMQTGTQMQLQQAAGAQGASSAYAAAQQRMADIDQQRRAMQYDVVSNSMSQELSNKSAGYAMESGINATTRDIQNEEIGGRMTNIQNQYNAKNSAYNTTMNTFTAGTNAMATGASNIYSAQQAQAQTGLALDRENISNQTNAANYMPQAQMSMNNQKRQWSLANKGLAIQQQSVNTQGQGINPFAAGMAGAGVGATVGGPVGAAVGFGAGVVFSSIFK